MWSFLFLEVKLSLKFRVSIQSSMTMPNGLPGHDELSVMPKSRSDTYWNF